ncbi:RluA family pseudouridine synthase [Hyphobacterium sp.]|uniref:RluA family pseudouridine synthase n=1 Tax=Hyphobacterium sp. TaxID=2004662 RepID=UPI003BACCB0D
MSGVQTLTVQPGEEGARLDKWFKRKFPHVPNGRLQKALRKGEIRVDGARAKADTRVEAGQSIRIPPLPDADPNYQKPEASISREDADYLRSLVIYQDKDLIAFNKPAGLAVQGGSKTTRHVDGLLAAFGKGDQKPRLVHRLDRDTSGVLVVAKTPAAAAKLAKAFQSRQTEKTYWAIVSGVPKPKTGEIKGFLKKDTGGAHGREQMMPAQHGEPGAQHALTRYTVVAEAGQKASWIAMQPITGRTHQLRVHASLIGHAIVGDKKYTSHRPIPDNLSGKLHLHARRLVLPLGGRPLALEADPPEHLNRTFAALGFNPADIDEAEIAELLA